MVLGLSILENLTMAIFDKMSKFGVINRRIEKDESSNSIRDMGIKCASATQRVRALSGGNQQKVVIGKWLSTVPSILIMDEPTRGIDVGSKSSDLRPNPCSRRRWEGHYPDFIGAVGDSGAQ